MEFHGRSGAGFAVALLLSGQGGIMPLPSMDLSPIRPYLPVAAAVATIVLKFPARATTIRKFLELDTGSAPHATACNPDPRIRSLPGRGGHDVQQGRAFPGVEHDEPVDDLLWGLLCRSFRHNKRFTPDNPQDNPRKEQRPSSCSRHDYRPTVPRGTRRHHAAR